jgi:hypothetical protein
MRKAAAADPKIEERRHSGAEARRRDQIAIARHLKRQRALRPGFSEQQATDILWLHSSADIYRLLVHDSGCPAKRYEGWLADTLKDVLLPRARPDTTPPSRATRSHRAPKGRPPSV